MTDLLSTAVSLGIIDDVEEFLADMPRRQLGAQPGNLGIHAKDVVEALLERATDAPLDADDTAGRNFVGDCYCELLVLA